MCCATMIFTETLQRAEPEQPTAHKERQAETVADHGVHRDSREEEFWKLVTSCNRRTAAALPAGLQLHSRQRALIAGEGQKALSGEASEPKSCRSTWRDRRVIVGDCRGPHLLT